MSSIKTYDRTIREPVRYIRTERAPAPAPATAAPLYPGQARQASGRIFTEIIVVAAPGARPLWAAGTAGHSGSVLILQADGDAILDAPGNVTLWSTNTSKQTYAVVQLPAHGWGPDQFGCLNSIWVRESGWNERAGHPASAYGIPQVLRAAASRCSWG